MAEQSWEEGEILDDENREMGYSITCCSSFSQVCKREVLETELSKGIDNYCKREQKNIEATRNKDRRHSSRNLWLN